MESVIIFGVGGIVYYLGLLCEVIWIDRRVPTLPGNLVFLSCQMNVLKMNPEDGSTSRFSQMLVLVHKPGHHNQTEVRDIDTAVRTS
jgi:hypothetical protein